MNTKRYSLVKKLRSSYMGVKNSVYQTDRNNHSKKIGCGFFAQKGKIIVVGIRTKEKCFGETVIKFSLGHSLLHEGDISDIYYGVHLAIKRSLKEKKKNLYTTAYTMLNDGFCQAMVDSELTHIWNNIKDYYDEYKPNKV